MHNSNLVAFVYHGLLDTQNKNSVWLLKEFHPLSMAYQSIALILKLYSLEFKKTGFYPVNSLTILTNR